MSQLNVGTVNISSLLVLPQYSTSQLPSGVAVGTIVFDTDEEAMVIWNGSEWSSAGGGGGGAIGGSLQSANGYNIHTFSSDGALTVEGGSGLTVDVLLVGGGGGGGTRNAGPNSGGTDGGSDGGAVGWVQVAGMVLNAGT